tara:strand:+ start:1172 stop:1411 length:240 start_codon:yes stop_codon:yes gene_type:complete
LSLFLRTIFYFIARFSTPLFQVSLHTFVFPYFVRDGKGKPFYFITKLKMEIIYKLSFSFYRLSEHFPVKGTQRYIFFNF